MPATERVHIVYDFTKPPEKIFAYLSEHENLGPLFGAKITRICDGTDSRNGVGSRRAVKVGPLPPLEETVTAAEPNTLIEYEITKFAPPISDHWGRQTFEPHDGGTRMTYRIGLDAKVPGVAAILGKKLSHDILKELPNVDQQA